MQLAAGRCWFSDEGYLPYNQPRMDQRNDDQEHVVSPAEGNELAGEALTASVRTLAVTPEEEPAVRAAVAGEPARKGFDLPPPAAFSESDDRITFYAPLTGFFAACKGVSTGSKHPVIFINIGTGEVALTVQLDERVDGEHILVDRGATILAIHTRHRFDMWSLTDQKFLYSIPAMYPKVAYFSSDGSKLVFDDNKVARKRVNVVQTDAATMLWSSEVEYDGQYLSKGHSVTSCFSASNEHLVILFTDYVQDERNNYLDRVTLRFYTSTSGVVDQTTVVFPFSADTVHPGTSDTAVIVTGAQFKQLGVVLVGSNLTATRIVLIPTSILPIQSRNGSRFIRLGPSNTLIVSLNDQFKATVVSYDCRLEGSSSDSSRTGVDAVRKVSDIVLAKPFNGFDKFAVQSSTNRMAVGFSPVPATWSTLREIHCYDLAGGTLLDIFRSPAVVADVGVAEDGNVILL
jgi:hypothetical protein